MKSTSPFSMAAALVLVVPLTTVLLFSVTWDKESALYRVVLLVFGPVAFLGTFLMLPVAMIDAALFGGVYFRGSLFGFEPRDAFGWALYLGFYLILALLAGFAASSWPKGARAARRESAPARRAAEPSPSGSLSRAAAVSPPAIRTVLGVPVRIIVAVFSALALLWIAVPREIAPTAENNDRKDIPPECGGEPLRRLSQVQAPRLIERHEPVYSDEARSSKVKGTVQVTLSVLSSGEVCEPKIFSGLHPEVNASIRAAVKTWRFSPATYQGAPVAVATHVSVKVDFSDPDPAASRRAAERAAMRNNGAAPGP